MTRDFLVVLAFLGLWIVLNKWILPWMGIPTCMSGGCGPTACELPQRHEPRADSGDASKGGPETQSVMTSENVR